jgi:predicted nucleotidyltransferase
MTLAVCVLTRPRPNSDVTEFNDCLLRVEHDNLLFLMLKTLTKRRLKTVVTDKAAAHLRAFRREAERALPGKITSVILFGSRARGDARRDSDYDVAVVIRSLDDRRTIDHTLADVAYSHILAGYHIRPVAIPADFLTVSSRSSLAAELLRDGVIVA